MHAEEIPAALVVELRRASRHEAGHWIVARLFGFPSEGITCGFQQAVTDISLDRPAGNFGALRVYCEQRTKVLLAGYLAEHVKYEMLDPTALSENGDWCNNDRFKQDREKFGELVAVLSNMDGAAAGFENRNKLQKRLWKETGELLLPASAALDDIAEAVFATPIGTMLPD